MKANTKKAVVSKKTSAKKTSPKGKKAIQTTVKPDASWGTTGQAETPSNVVAMPTAQETTDALKDALSAPATGETEATTEEIKKDIARSEGTQPTSEVGINPEETVKIMDELTTSVVTWNNRNLIDIQLRENSNVLNRFDYVPTQLVLPDGKKTKYSILTCSDNKIVVGKPFAGEWVDDNGKKHQGSYGLLNNSDFICVIESICAVLDSMGLKWKVATTGTLKNRERSFISLVLCERDSFTVDGREIKAYLNCLNSIPSNAGCTVTFANNTFTICCRNTAAMVLRNKDGAKFHAAIKHTKGMKAALKDIPLLVEAYISGNERLFKDLKSFSEFPISLEQAEQYFAAFIGRDSEGGLTDKTELKTRSANIVETLRELFVKGDGNRGETAFDAWNAVTQFYTHMSAGAKDTVKQFESSEIGSGYQNKGEFYQWLVTHLQSKSAFQAVARVGDTLLVNYRKAKTAKVA